MVWQAAAKTSKIDKGKQIIVSAVEVRNKRVFDILI